MSFNYTSLAKTSKDLIDKFGAAVTYTAKSAGVYDPITGTFTEIDVQHTVTAVFQELGGGLSNSQGKANARSEFLVEGGISFTPKINDRINDGQEWSVVSIDRNKPANTILTYALGVELV